jgi:hypothetical protein
MGRVRSRSSAILTFSRTGSRNIRPLGAGASVSPMGVSRSGFGVPSGPGEPATEDRGVASLSARRLRRLKDGGFCGVAATVAGSVPFMGGSLGEES